MLVLVRRSSAGRAHTADRRGPQPDAAAQGHVHQHCRVRSGEGRGRLGGHGSDRLQPRATNAAADTAIAGSAQEYDGAPYFYVYKFQRQCVNATFCFSVVCLCRRPLAQCHAAGRLARRAAQRPADVCGARLRMLGCWLLRTHAAKVDPATTVGPDPLQLLPPVVLVCRTDICSVLSIACSISSAAREQDATAFFFPFLVAL